VRRFALCLLLLCLIVVRSSAPLPAVAGSAGYGFATVKLSSATALPGTIGQQGTLQNDTGHILLSSTFAELLEQVGDRDWTASLHDLGTCEVKHGEKLHLFNLYTDEVGNSSLPSKLRTGLSAVSHRPSVPATEGRRLTADGRGPSRVALLYKRNAEPDEHVLQLLETEFRAAGHSVFIDRHLEVGMAWALEIDPAHRPPESPDIGLYQPTFLYESLWDLGVAVLLVWVGRRFALDNGRLFALYVAAYTAGRAWIEALRVDHANHILGLRLNDWTSMVVFLIAVAFLLLRRPHNQRPETATATAPTTS